MMCYETFVYTLLTRTELPAKYSRMLGDLGLSLSLSSSVYEKKIMVCSYARMLLNYLRS